MKKNVTLIAITALIFSLSSCAVHYGLPSNQNKNNTEVVLQGANYTVVQKVQGTADSWIVFGFGGSFKPLAAQARANMLASADLIGKSRAVINEVVEVNDKFFVVCSKKTVTISAHVVEFTGTANSVKTTNSIKTPTKTETPTVIYNDIDSGFGDDFEDNDTNFGKTSQSAANNTPRILPSTNSEEIAQRPADTEAISGKWSRENDGFVITIKGNVATLTQVKTGFWARLVNNGRISIGHQVFRNFTKIDNTTWQVQELVVGATTSNWRSTTITLKDGTLIIGNPQNGYVLTK